MKPNGEIPDLRICAAPKSGQDMCSHNAQKKSSQLYQ